MLIIENLLGLKSEQAAFMVILINRWKELISWRHSTLFSSGTQFGWYSSLKIYVKTIFHYATLGEDEKVYAEINLDLKQCGYNWKYKVLCLKITPYGLNQTPHTFWKYLTEKIVDFGLLQINFSFDSCLLPFHWQGSHCHLLCLQYYHLCKEWRE